MPSKPRKRKKETEVLRVEGELTIYRAAELKPQILGRTPPAAIDLSGVTEIDTAGLQLLMLARKAALDEQRALPLLAPSAAVREVFALLNLGAHLEAAPAPAGT
jgi:anti-sigma B factor antagonist